MLLDIRVQPRASSDGFAEEPGDRIKPRITAPAVDDKSNRHLIALLARTFKVAKNDISIISGETGRNKRIKIRRPAHLPEIFSHCG